jgi:hypothetical protein
MTSDGGLKSECYTSCVLLGDSGNKRPEVGLVRVLAVPTAQQTLVSILVSNEKRFTNHHASNLYPDNIDREQIMQAIYMVNLFKA